MFTVLKQRDAPVERDPSDVDPRLPSTCQLCHSHTVDPEGFRPQGLDHEEAEWKALLADCFLDFDPDLAKMYVGFIVHGELSDV